MRLRQPQTTALLLLLPALHAFAKAVPPTDKTPVARLATPKASPTPLATPAPQAKGTKDAPVDGFDGKPHQGPYVDDKPIASKKGPGGIEELRPDTRKDPKDAKGPKPALAKELSKEEWKALGDEDDSVMNDPNRASPKGNTGTEGSLSAKEKERIEHEKTGTKVEKVPTPPKAAPPLPHGEQQHLKEKEKEKPKPKPDSVGEKSTETETPRVLGAQGLEVSCTFACWIRIVLTIIQKPVDLPDSPHDIPHPVPPSSSKKDPLDTTPPKTPPKSPAHLPGDSEAGGVIQPFHSLVLSFTMIIFSEIGDKTFLVAALMAMRHPRLLVFSAAFSALIVMTVLSAVLGHAVPTLIPERFTHLAAAGLFLVFGVKLMREGLAMSPEDGVGEEMREVEQELEEKEHQARNKGRRKASISPYALESGRAARRSRSNSRLPAPARSPSSSPDRAHSPGASSTLGGLNNLLSLLLSPAWVQTFVMTFLGEWGDRSQIATVAMAAGSDYWWVTAGAIFGHGLCTAGAVIGGRAIAGKVSMRVGMLNPHFINCRLIANVQ
jgi:putative Ca2+/H+ antiporter (TMEM165/GDT1 family)